MATTREKTETTIVFVSKAEMANMLGNRALAAGILTLAPDSVEMLPGNEPDPDGGQDLQGWVVEFKRNL
jgi:hypothetical protein